MESLTHLVCFLFLLRELMFRFAILVLCLGSLFVWVVSPCLPITDRFPWHQYCLRCLSIRCRFVSEALWNSVVCFQPLSMLIGNFWVLLSVSHTLQSASKRLDARIVQIYFSHQGIRYKLSSVGVGGPMVLPCLYWPSFYQIDHITLLWIVVE